MKTLAITAYLVLLAASSPAIAEPAFSLEMGISNYEHPPCMLWHQECAGYHTDWDTTPPAFRVSAETNKIRLSYFDLGTYAFHGRANNNESCIASGGGVACQGGTPMYYTTGSMRGISITFRPRLGPIFLEAGPAYFRQAFKEEKDDGFKFNGVEHGPGYVLGAGIEGKNLALGVYTYRTNACGKMGESYAGEYPCGTGYANVVSIGYKF